MQTFLESKTVPLKDTQITITQLSGLDRFNFMDYCTDLPKPKNPVKPAEDASQEECEKYLEDMEKNIKQWHRVNFMGQSRLVAYGYRDGVEDLDERHNQIMASMTPEQVKFLHDEIAKFSGIPLPEPDTQENTESEEDVSSEPQEPVDPKV